MNKYLTSQSYPFSISNSKYYLLLFLLWPFLAFITALINYSRKEARKVVYIFLIYYGFTFVVGNSGVDSERYALQLKTTAELPFSDFFKIIGGLYSDTSVDIVEPLVSFIVTRFTSYHGVYFAVWAAIFGFFYLKSINFLHDRNQKNQAWDAMIIMAFFIMIMPITTISGVRMATATWIFFYGACHVVLNRDARYLILSLSAALVHWSFFTVNILLIIYFIAGNRNLLYLPVVFLSFILPQLLAPLFQSISLKTGGALQHRYEGYSNEDYILGIQDSYKGASWFMGLSDDLIFYYLLFAIIIIQVRYGSLLKEKAERNLFSFLLLFLSFVNFGKVIPTFGGRFQQVFYLFAAFYIFLGFLKMPGKKIGILTLIGLFPMLLYCAIMFRMGSESISAWIFLPGFGLPLFAPILSLSNMIFN